MINTKALNKDYNGLKIMFSAFQDLTDGTFSTDDYHLLTIQVIDLVEFESEIPTEFIITIEKVDGKEIGDKIWTYDSPRLVHKKNKPLRMNMIGLVKPWNSARING